MLTISNLSFGYRRGQKDLFGGLHHDFAQGAVTAVTGPSGRGKSTLLYLLGLMLRPSEGSILLDGVPVQSLPDRQRSALRATQIGFVFQDAVLDTSRTVLDAVLEPALYGGFRRVDKLRRARELLDQMGVADRESHRPGEISGGQAQRVALCRALLNDPGVVLADEPTGNLDRANAQTVLSALRSAAVGAGRTVVVATHDPFVLEHADQILELS
ncbi:ABC transporter ATP-binding protein [Micromonospora gifhornensis]|uniref:ABC transporter ATP-binding protein n=1 Tax=Micromonospora gifhornensis TaxID=84594 RepID=UPI003D739636